MCLKWPLGIGDLLLGTKTKLFFISIYVLECLFLWYMSDLDLWLSVMGYGVISTIASAYTPRHKENIYKIDNIEYSLLKIYQA
jgi:hypothetical protein